MKILKVIHGYPPAYNAGSEVYSQTLCLGLAKQHDVHVFSREENPFLPDYAIRVENDTLNTTIKKHLINIPLLRQRYRYRHLEVDRVFGKLLDQVNPDVVHIGHLNHLSTTIVDEVDKRNIPIVYTLHDFWMICARGQFLQRNPSNQEDLWPLCDGQENEKCAKRCYAGYFSGLDSEKDQEITYWTKWFKARMDHMKKIVHKVDLFIAPSHHLMERYQSFFNLPQEKIIYMDYGFDLKRLKGRVRSKEKGFIYGYIGTHTPQKGIHHLIEAFGKCKTPSRLRIWGRERGEVTPGLKSFVSKLPLEKRQSIEWMGEYQNENIVKDVFNKVDAIVVPSIWEENSPLVIHEAQQCCVPIVTANIGGMSEYVHHNINGLLFEHRNSVDMAAKMDWLSKNPITAQALGQKGYLYSKTGSILDMDVQVKQLEKIYASLLHSKREAS